MSCGISIDSSGIRIYYTPAMRKYELGNVQIGQDDIEIPAGAVRKEVAGGCRNYCTSKLFTKPFYLTRTFIHMHSLGMELITHQKIILIDIIICTKQSEKSVNL